MPESAVQQPLRKLDAAAKAWWLKFLQHLGLNGIREKHQVWYRGRVEQLLPRDPNHWSVDVVEVAVEEFLADLGGLERLDWHLLHGPRSW